MAKVLNNHGPALFKTLANELLFLNLQIEIYLYREKKTSIYVFIIREHSNFIKFFLYYFVFLLF